MSGQRYSRTESDLVVPVTTTELLRPEPIETYLYTCWNFSEMMTFLGLIESAGATFCSASQKTYCPPPAHRKPSWGICLPDNPEGSRYQSQYQVVYQHTEEIGVEELC